MGKGGVWGNDGDDEGPSLVKFQFAHSEGITAVEIVKDGDDEKLLTCGSDSELRVWKGFDDEDPVAHAVTDAACTLACWEQVAYIGTEFNTVEAISVVDGKNLGVTTKFTAPVNHIDVSKDGSWLAAGSGDMTIQIVDLRGSGSPPTKINTHSAPVLSVALDPLKKFLVSSGCDGNVCIWSLSDERQPIHQVKKFEKLYSPTNDISLSETLCRVSWDVNGKILAIPEKHQVTLYTRDTWIKLKDFKFKKSEECPSVTRFSPCGTYIAAGGADGTLVVWNVKDAKIIAEHKEFSDHITGLTFANNAKDIIAVDKKGRTLLLKDFTGFIAAKTASKEVSKPKASNNTKDPENRNDGEDDPSQEKQTSDDEFNDGFDDLFSEDMDDNEISISKIKAETGFVDDEYVGVDKAKKVIIGGELRDGNKTDDDNDDVVSVSSIGSKSHLKQSVAPPPPRIVIPFTEPQKPLQPGSSPVHLDHRFMIWNNVGIIRNYSHDDDEKDAIDIEFHDAAVHHAVHLRNQDDYTIGVLTKEVAVFSNEKHGDTGSKLFCYNFNSWDSKKEWSTELPPDEEVIGIAAGEGWIAASTDMNRIRIFTTGGAQRQIIDVGGQIISTSGHEDLLFVTYHNGIGLHGNQSIAYSIFKIKANLKPFPLVACEPLPLTPKSQVAWVGFSDEGTPVCSDSANVLRILSGRYWTTFCVMKEQLIGASDHFWVVGVSELMQRIRAVKCKGMRYPPTLPRPVLMQLDAQTPLCEMSTEKSRLEDRYNRSMMLDALAKKMDKKNYEVEDYKTQAEKELKESLFNLFVLSCKGDWDARGTEYVGMMPSAHSVQVAIKYASKLRKKGLMDRLAAIGRRKLDEEEMATEGDDDDFETLKMGTVVYSNVLNRTLNSTADYSISQDSFAESSFSRLSNINNSSLSTSTTKGNRSITAVPDEENPFIKRNNDEIRKLLGSSDIVGGRFRKGSNQDEASENAENKGLSIIDSWKKPSEKPADLFAKNFAKSKSKKGADKEKSKDQPGGNKEKKKQATLLNLRSKKPKESSNSNPASPLILDDSNDCMDSESLSENAGQLARNDEIIRNSESLLEDSTNIRQGKPQGEPPKRGFMLWFEENRDALEKANPGVSAAELAKLGTQQFKKLPDEERQKYLNPTSEPIQDKKRKRSDVDDSSEDVTESDKKSRISSKLAAFVRVADD